MAALRAILVLLTGRESAAGREAEIQAAREELDAALAALREARAGWTGAETIDIEAVRRALDAAERQLDAARVRLERAIAGGRGDPKD